MRYLIIDLVGKSGRIRNIPVPQWVEDAVERWIRSARIKNGRLFRCVRKNGRVWGCKLSPNVVWCVVKKCAATYGIDNLAPHDLRRTCARLCHAEGGELEQIQFLRGHASVQTIERYIGCKQKLTAAVNESIATLARRCVIDGDDHFGRARAVYFSERALRALFDLAESG